MHGSTVRASPIIAVLCCCSILAAAHDRSLQQLDGFSSDPQQSGEPRLDSFSCARAPHAGIRSCHAVHGGDDLRTCTGWQSWSGGDTTKQTPSTAAQPAQPSYQSFLAKPPPMSNANPLGLQPITTPDLGGGTQRWIKPALSCNPWSGNSSLNGCITPQVRPCQQGTYEAV